MLEKFAKIWSHIPKASLNEKLNTRYSPVFITMFISWENSRMWNSHFGLQFPFVLTLLFRVSLWLLHPETPNFLESISSTVYASIFRTKSNWAANLCLEFDFEQTFVQKCTSKMLMKLTPGSTNLLLPVTNIDLSNKSSSN